MDDYSLKWLKRTKHDPLTYEYRTPTLNDNFFYYYIRKIEDSEYEPFVMFVNKHTEGRSLRDFEDVSQILDTVEKSQSICQNNYLEHINY